MNFLNTRLAVMVTIVVFSLAACGGGGGSSAAGTPPLPSPVSVPSAPTSVIATAGKASVNVVFTAPSGDGGSAITGYTVSTNPAGGVDRDAGSVSLNHTVTGLANGVSYTFTVTANNAAGVSAASSTSNAAIPSQPVQWSITGSLQTARSGHTATLLPDGTVLVVGGQNTSGVERYEPAARVWTAVGALASSRLKHTATLLPNGKLLIVGGWSVDPNFKAVELYDIASNSAIAGPNPTFSFSYHSATLLLNGKVLVTGGYTGDNSTQSKAALYDPTTNAWAAGAAMARARMSHTSTLLQNGRVLVVGGYNVDAQSPHGAELYDPTTNTWADAASIPVAFTTGSATLLPNGKVLLVSDFKSNVKSTDPNAALYDPATNTWTLAGSNSTDHVNHTATLLSNGTVLTAGGGRYSASTGFTTGTDVCELYDPATNTWSLTNSLIMGPRSGHTATRLGNGSVLAAGGSDVDGFGLPARTDASLYELL